MLAGLFQVITGVALKIAKSENSVIPDAIIYVLIKGLTSNVTEVPAGVHAVVLLGVRPT